MEFIRNIVSFFYCALTDYVIFIIIDLVFKQAIVHSQKYCHEMKFGLSRVNREKRNLFLIEAGIVGSVGLLVHLVSHFPYVIYGLAGLNAVYALSKQLVSPTEMIQFLRLIYRFFQYHVSSLVNTVQRWQRIRKRKSVADRWDHATGYPSPLVRTPKMRQSQLFTTSALIGATESKTSHRLSPALEVDDPPSTADTVGNPPSLSLLEALSDAFQSVRHRFKHVIAGGSIASSIGLVSRWFMSALPVVSYDSLVVWCSSVRGRIRLQSSRSFDTNLCFLYSVMHCLAHIPGFKQALNKQSRISKRSPAYKAFIDLIEQPSHPSIGGSNGTTTPPPPLNLEHLVRALASPAGLPGIVSETESGGGGQRQHDAVEFYTCLINLLHDEAKGKSNTYFCPKTIDRLSYIYGDLNEELVSGHISALNREMDVVCRGDSLSALLARGPSRSALIKSAQLLLYRQRIRDEASALRSFFEIQSLSLILCPSCRRLRVISEPLLVLPVALPDPNKTAQVDLSDSIRANFSKVEHFEDLDCALCGFNPGKATKLVSSSRSLPLPPSSTPSSLSSAGNGFQPDLRPSQGNSSNVTALMSPINPLTYGGLPSSLRDPLDGTNLTAHYQQPQQKTSTPILPRGQQQQAHSFQRRFMLGHLPTSIAVHLLRFRGNDGQSPHKNTIPVRLPLSGLSLAAVSLTDDAEAGQRYQLSGLVMHSGSGLSSGHYTALFSSQEGQWFHADDSRVVPVLSGGIEAELLREDVQRGAYLLFYTRETSAAGGVLSSS